MENSMIYRRSIQIIAGAKFDIEKSMLGDKIHSSPWWICDPHRANIIFCGWYYVPREELVLK